MAHCDRSIYCSRRITASELERRCHNYASTSRHFGIYQPLEPEVVGVRNFSQRLPEILLDIRWKNAKGFQMTTQNNWKKSKSSKFSSWSPPCCKIKQLAPIKCNNCFTGISVSSNAENRALHKTSKNKEAQVT